MAASDSCSGRVAPKDICTTVPAVRRTTSGFSVVISKPAGSVRSSSLSWNGWPQARGSASQGRVKRPNSSVMTPVPLGETRRTPGRPTSEVPPSALKMPSRLRSSKTRPRTVPQEKTGSATSRTSAEAMFVTRAPAELIAQASFVRVPAPPAARIAASKVAVTVPPVASVVAGKTSVLPCVSGVTATPSSRAEPSR